MGLAYIIAEFCSQSHLATEDFRNASEGLKLTRRFKKYTYWLRLLLSWDEILLQIWKAIRFRWWRVTGQRPKVFKKALIWDWRVKPGGAGRTPLHVLDQRSRRRSSTQPLMDHSQDQGSGDEGLETQAHNREQYSTRDRDRSHIELPTLQLPPQVHSDNTFLQPPSPSSDISRSSSDYSRQEFSWCKVALILAGMLFPFKVYTVAEYSLGSLVSLSAVAMLASRCRARCYGNLCILAT